jgi:hypothetical protein
LAPSVTWRVATPFAKSLAIVALEAAVAVGWPLGWGLALLSHVETGEARVYRLLGEGPLRSVLRLAPQAAAFAFVLASLAWASARESTEPGRIVSDLIAEGHTACAEASEPRTYAVPFFDATWLCDPGFPPRLVGQGPGSLSALVFTARGARTSGDLGSIDLDDAHIALSHPSASLHVDRLHLQAGAPWGHASTVSPLARAATLSSAVTLSALVVALLVLTRRSTGRVLTFATASAGPLAALGLLRAAERYSAARAWLVLVPALAVAATLLISWLGARLPALWHTASNAAGSGLPLQKEEHHG